MQKDEIKEIIYLEKYIDKYKSDEKSIINGNRLTTPAMLDYLEAKDLLDYITNLQVENERLKNGYCELKAKCNNGECDCTNEEYNGMVQANMKGKLLLEDYKSRNEKAIENIDLVIELIKQQPTEDDSWILNRLNGFKYLLQGSDKDEFQENVNR